MVFLWNALVAFFGKGRGCCLVNVSVRTSYGIHDLGARRISETAKMLTMEALKNSMRGTLPEVESSHKRVLEPPDLKERGIQVEVQIDLGNARLPAKTKAELSEMIRRLFPEGRGEVVFVKSQDSEVTSKIAVPKSRHT